MRIRIALVAALLCFGGCTYMGRRGADFLDQFRISVGAISLDDIARMLPRVRDVMAGLE